MTSEYEKVRTKILSGGTARRTSLPAITPLTPIISSPTQPSHPVLPITNSSKLSPSTQLSHPFISTLTAHVKSLSDKRLSQGFLHLHPSPIHDVLYLKEPSRQYLQLTDLFRRIDINLFNISSFRLEKFLSTILTRLIHSSTYLSHSGTDIATTARICHSIFTDSGITELNLPHTAGYLSELQTIIEQGRSAEFATVLRGREQVAHYTKALVYFIRSLLTEGGELTQDLIKETHRILVQDHEPVDGKIWEQFGGWYRDYLDAPISEPKTPTITAEIVNTALNIPTSRRPSSVYPMTPTEEIEPWQRRGSINPRTVGTHMSKIINAYHAQLAMDRTDQGEGTVSDPFALNAWLVCEFLYIHPFVIGNEEMSRIILSGVLLKELGIVAVIGDEKEPGRLEYLGILKTCGDKHREDDEDGRGETGESYAEFAAFIVKRATTCVEELAALVGSS
ncbi:hypothetical protein ABW20_dc0101162 [Dactylellina cionopaga]|nr:hypothetical protein ABW20_dc0101162 [Dactylellina cionopaga]